MGFDRRLVCAWLKFSGDYFHYDYQDLILAGADPQSIVNDCFAGTIDANTCARISQRGQDGQLATVIQEIVNGGSAKVDGVDLVASYTTDLFDGSIRFDANSTIITNYEAIDPDGVVTDIRNSRNTTNGFGSVPAFRLNAGVTYNTGAQTFTVFGRHIGSYEDDENGATIDSNTTFDVRYDVQLGEFINLPGETTRFSVGATNVFDVTPPLLENRPRVDFEVHDPRGRSIYVQLKQNF